MDLPLPISIPLTSLDLWMAPSLALSKSFDHPLQSKDHHQSAYFLASLDSMAPLRLGAPQASLQSGHPSCCQPPRTMLQRDYRASPSPRQAYLSPEASREMERPSLAHSLSSVFRRDIWFGISWTLISNDRKSRSAIACKPSRFGLFLKHWCLRLFRRTCQRKGTPLDLLDRSRLFLMRCLRRTFVFSSLRLLPSFDQFSIWFLL